MFIDTNVLVKSRISRAPDHEVARASLECAFQDPEPLRISREDAFDDVSRLIGSFDILEDGPVVTESLVALCREVPVEGRQIHDANVVATMLAHGEYRLLTFNAADFRRYGNRIELVGN